MFSCDIFGLDALTSAVSAVTVMPGENILHEDI